MTLRHRLSGLAAVVGMTVVGLVVGVLPAHADYSPAPRKQYTVSGGTVYAMAVTADRVYIGGSFSKVTDLATNQGSTRTGLAAFDRGTGQLLGWAPSVVGTVRSLVVSPSNQNVYVGGEFTSVNGTGRLNAAAVDPSGQLTGWNPAPDKIVRSQVVVGDQIYLAGRFGSVNGVRRLGLARVSDSTGAVDRTFVADTGNGKAFSVAVDDAGTNLLVGGNFTSLNGSTRMFLAAVSLADGSLSPWSPTALCDTCSVLDIATDGAGGIYTAIAGNGGRAAKWTQSAPGAVWSVRGDGDCQSIAVRDGVVYVGGHFGPSFDGAVRHQLAAVTADRGVLLPWDPNLGGNDHPGTWALDAGSDFLRVGGGFATVAGGPPARYAEFPTL